MRIAGRFLSGSIGAKSSVQPHSRKPSGRDYSNALIRRALSPTGNGEAEVKTSAHAAWQEKNKKC